MAKRIAILLTFLLIGQAFVISSPAKSVEQKKHPIFVFHTDEFWLNLNHFLYVLGRAENKTTEATREAVVLAPADQDRGFTKLSVKEHTTWREIVTSYAAGFSKKDLVFDESASAITSTLAGAGDARSLKGMTVDPALAALLERAAPIYRKAWWTDHRKSKTGSLAGTKRHDYLPFGEEFFAGQGARTMGLGYTGDTARQKFTSKERLA